MKKWFTNWTQKDWDDFYVTAFASFAIILLAFTIFCLFAGLYGTALFSAFGSFSASVMYCIAWKDRNESQS